MTSPSPSVTCLFPRGLCPPPQSLFTIWGFNFPILIAFLQMVVMAPITYAMARPAIKWETVRTVAPIAVVNVLNVVFGLIGTAGLNVPMFIALRRFTLITTIICEWVIYRKGQDLSTKVNVLIMVSGALIAALNDLSFNLYGYGAVLVNNVFTSLYLVFVKNIRHDLTTTGLMFYNSMLSLPLLLVLLIASGQHESFLTYSMLTDTGFLVTLAMSCFLGLSINHSTFLCTKTNDPLTTSVAGSLKNIFMTLFGAIAFGDFIFHPFNALGLAISLLGSCSYTYFKVKKQITASSTAATSSSGGFRGV